MPELTIDRLSLRLSGLSELDGRHLARLIAEKLASTSLPEWDAGYDQMTSSVVAQPGASVHSLAEQIVSEVVRQLDRSL
jgi:hypothetical protein